MFAAFIFLPTRFWPRIDRELPFLAIALYYTYFGLELCSAIVCHFSGVALQFIHLFRYASPSSSFRCSRKRPSLLSLACASGRLSFAVGEHYYCVYFLLSLIHI